MSSWFEDHQICYRREGVGDAMVFVLNAALTRRLWENQFEQPHYRTQTQMPLLSAKRGQKPRLVNDRGTFS